MTVLVLVEHEDGTFEVAPTPEIDEAGGLHWDPGEGPIFGSGDTLKVYGQRMVTL